MEYRKLGRTGIKVSPLCVGTMNFPYRTPEDEAIAIIDAAIDKGINFIDTANFYGQPLNEGTGQGISETLLGKALKGKRDKVVLATKFFATMDRTDPNARGGSRRHIMQAVEDSLRRLDTDYIDLYQMHRPDPDIPIDETLRALDDVVRSGKVRYIGTSRFAAWQLLESLWTSDQLKLNRFVSEQPRYNILMREIEMEVIPAAQEHGLAILPYSPLAGGILAGKYKAGQDAPDDSRMKDPAWGTWAQSFMKDHTPQVLEALNQMAAEKNCTLSQLSLAWVIAQPGITSAIIGPRTIEHFEDNYMALEVVMETEDFEKIDLVSPPVDYQ